MLLKEALGSIRSIVTNGPLHLMLSLSTLSTKFDGKFVIEMSF